ncbi:type II secretion system protein [Lentisphaera profundi]|uniref:Type II secretion system protein n=1 Tax=Lentisphaera profundi TaxID=1658616 RepID=A0ABY7VN40_9BACT|nr:type II secretion system protein [Lentisphaera profundi]WDE95282.1 type II secretion system protein [Lentisphaera profundi]
MRKKQVSLIEILVVVAIIGILASLLLPALGKARDTSRKAVCKNNLKQLSLATISYEMDFESLPALGGNSAPWYGAHTADAMLMLYEDYLGGGLQGESSIKNAVKFNPPSFYICPSNPKESYWSGRYGSYGLFAGSSNDIKMSMADAQTGFSSMANASVNGPWGTSPAMWADMSFIGDSSPYGTTADTNHAKGGVPNGSNVSHLDGSVSWYRYYGADVPTEKSLAKSPINGQVLQPITSFFFYNDGTGNINTSIRAGGTLVTGRSMFDYGSL